MKIIARIFSTIFHPLLMPSLGTLFAIFFSYLVFYPPTLKLVLMGVIMLFTLLLPAIFIIILYKRKVISDIGLNKREERGLPYLMTFISYGACALLLYRFSVPLWILGFMCGAILSLITAWLISYKWKISAHATGAGGFLACLFYIMTKFEMLPLWFFCLMILCVGMLCTSRIILNRHTFGQVVAGTANGLFWILLCIYLI